MKHPVSITYVFALIALVWYGCTKKDIKPTPPAPPAAPVASFNFAVANAGMLPAQVGFTFTGSNTTSYFWDFGDGDTASVSNPTHAYKKAGSFNVKLVATGAGGKDSTVKPVVITQDKPKPAFTFVITDNGHYPVHVNFTSTTVAADSLRWSFDNGDTSSLSNPIDSFFAAKTFNVKLVAFNAAGKDSVSVPVTITINKPTANFSYSITNSAQVPCVASLSNTSTNAATYKWYLADGTTATTLNVQASFNQPRLYNIKLVATNSAGSDSVTKTVTVLPILKSVVVYLITPKDKQFNPAYYNALKNATLNLQTWYKTAMGNNKTFTLNPMILDTLTGLHDSAWYNSDNGAAISGSDPRYYGYYNTFNDLSKLLGSSFNTTSYVYFVYVAAPGGGAGASGFCAMGDQDLKGLLGINPENLNPNRWIGGGGHELGHAFGLNHPDNQNAQAIMWTGYLTYPNCILQQADKDILNAGAFFK